MSGNVTLCGYFIICPLKSAKKMKCKKKKKRQAARGKHFILYTSKWEKRQVGNRWQMNGPMMDCIFVSKQSQLSNSQSHGRRGTTQHDFQFSWHLGVLIMYMVNILRGQYPGFRYGTQSQGFFLALPLLLFFVFTLNGYKTVLWIPRNEGSCHKFHITLSHSLPHREH